jgi:hypothetical protein
MSNVQEQKESLERFERQKDSEWFCEKCNKLNFIILDEEDSSICQSK